MEKVFFIHIEPQNVAHYFRCACIKPSKYFENRIEDIQSKFGDFLLLSTKMYSKDMDCSFEVILTENENKLLIKVDTKKEFFILNTVIPISRIKKIHFKNHDVKDKIITLVNMSSGFIPLELAVTTLADKNLINSNSIKVQTYQNVIDLSDKIRKYDSILGGFALMRLSGENYMNYSENYFSTLSYFNKSIENKLNDINLKYWDIFEGKNTFKVLYPYLSKKITEDDLNEIARSENQKIERKTISGLIEINSLERATYILSILYSYGVGDEGKRNKIDGLIVNNFKNEIKNERSEVVALCYGLNRGYTVFTNRYKANTIERTVKFELNSQIDYYTIESIYQYVFNDISKCYDFPYLDSWCPKQKLNYRKLMKNEYIVLDTVIIGEQFKVGSNKWWSNFMSFFFQKENEDVFKPLMIKIYDKIKAEIEYEQTEIIDKQKFEIKKLVEEKFNLQSKLRDYTLNQEQFNNTLKENLILKQRINELELVKQQNISKNKSKNEPTSQNYIAEPSSICVQKDEPKLNDIDYKSKYDACTKVLKEIIEKSKIADAKSLIKRHFDSNNLDLF